MRWMAFMSLVAALIVGCGGARTTDLTPEANRETVRNMPDWFTDMPRDADYLFATATMTSRDLQNSIQRAKTQAQRDLAEQLEANLGAKTKQFREEVGVGEDSEMLEFSTEAIQVVTVQAMNGARVDKKEIVTEGTIYRAYVLMRLPLGEANQALMEQIKANSRLHTELRSSKAFQELEAEIAKRE